MIRSYSHSIKRFTFLISFLLPLLSVQFQFWIFRRQKIRNIYRTVVTNNEEKNKIDRQPAIRCRQTGGWRRTERYRRSFAAFDARRWRTFCTSLVVGGAIPETVSDTTGRSVALYTTLRRNSTYYNSGEVCGLLLCASLL